MKTWHTCPGRMAEVVATLPHPDACAYQSYGFLGENVTIKQWPARAAMARTVRMQQQRGSSSRDWRPLIKLSDGEGY